MPEIQAFWLVLIIGGIAIVALVAAFVWVRKRSRSASPAPSTLPTPALAVSDAVRLAKERRDKTAVAEHQLLADMDGDLVVLQTELGKKRIQAMRARRTGTPSILIEQEVEDLEQEVDELDTQAAVHEAYLRAIYPEYWN